MLRAEQLALEQQANQQLLLIREKELNYFVSNYNSFGTQAALLAGFSLTALTSITPKDTGPEVAFSGILFIASCLCLTASLHCMLTTMFIGVWGPGLALRGPAGSMVRAVDGMIRERKQIFTSFGIAIFSFQLMGIATAWIVMKYSFAIVCTFIFMVGYYLVYKYTLRIYNRFRINIDGADWLGRSTDHYTQNPLGSFDNVGVSPPAFLKNQEGAYGGSDAEAFHGTDTAEQRPKFLSMLGIKGASKSDTVSQSLTAPLTDNVSMEGYLTKKGISQGILAPDPWARRYFVLQGKYLYYYKTREDYNSRGKAIKNRPIEITSYAVESSDPSKPPFMFRLRPVESDDERRVWDFRCDTDEELEQWVSAIEVYAAKVLLTPSEA